jgi:broad specificity phosphatase PhoE
VIAPKAITAAVILFCHAATGTPSRVAFPDDEPLSRFGERACTRVSKPRYASRVSIAPERRTRQTAQALGLTGEIEPALRDCDHGRWSGKSLDEVAAAEPEAIAKWLSDPGAAPHGGESQRAVLARVGAWLEARTRETARTIVVTHPTIIRAAIAHAIGTGAEVFQRIDVAPLSEAVLTWSNRWRFRRLGPIADLAEPPED